MMMRRLALVTLWIAVGTSASFARPQLLETATDIFRELIAINTAEPDGNTTKASELLASRLKDAGVAADDVKVLGPDDRHGNLVARLRGSGKGRRCSSWRTSTSCRLRATTGASIRSC
jgi:acetylornithine deacetylase/succinyl-diaminopimelate desuccinylase-like protein